MSILKAIKNKVSIVTTDNICIGMRVRRSNTWQWSTQDCDDFDNPVAGTIIEMSEDLAIGKIKNNLYYEHDYKFRLTKIWTSVKWDNNNINTYNIGPVNFDLIKTND